ncbi:MAG: hypothetical protein ACNA8K_13485 [Cyclonatronaceae bacterium]
MDITSENHITKNGRSGDQFQKAYTGDLSIAPAVRVRSCPSGHRVSLLHTGTGMLTVLAALFIGLILQLMAPADAVAQYPVVSDGINWQKTLRIRGVMKPFDPHRQSLELSVASGLNNRPGTTTDLTPYRHVTRNFWIALRDSMENAVRSGAVQAFTVERSTNARMENIFVKGTLLGYEELLGRMSRGMAESTRADDRITQMYDLTSGRLRAQSDLVREAEARGEAFFGDFRRLSMFELELIMYIDERGFHLKPMNLLLGTAHWDNPGFYDEDDLLAGFRDEFGNGVGFAIDLTDPNTVAYLSRSGIQVSGEYNILPFYDLITMFHYDFKIYSESNNVLADAADIGYELVGLENALQIKYNDLLLTNIYGQLPPWWIENQRSNITDGIYE